MSILEQGIRVDFPKTAFVYDAICSIPNVNLVSRGYLGFVAYGISPWNGTKEDEERYLQDCAEKVVKPFSSNQVEYFDMWGGFVSGELQEKRDHVYDQRPDISRVSRQTRMRVEQMWIAGGRDFEYIVRLPDKGYRNKEKLKRTYDVLNKHLIPTMRESHYVLEACGFNLVQNTNNIANLALCEFKRTDQINDQAGRFLCQWNMYSGLDTREPVCELIRELANTHDQTLKPLLS
jgi:hypothetical protein